MIVETTLSGGGGTVAYGFIQSNSNRPPVVYRSGHRKIHFPYQSTYDENRLPFLKSVFKHLLVNRRNAPHDTAVPVTFNIVKKSVC